MAGITETKEVLALAFEITRVVLKHLKDGVQPHDIASIVAELIRSPTFADKLKQASHGVSMVPTELSDLQFTEIVELVIYSVQQLVATFKSLN